MKPRLNQKRIDGIASFLLLLLLLLSCIYRSSPIDFINPHFPLLRETDFTLSEKFLLTSYSNPLRLTNVYNIEETGYFAQFSLVDTSQIFPDRNGKMHPTNFAGRQSLTYFSSPQKATETLEESYMIHVENEGDFPIIRTDIPLTEFISQADQYILWCHQFSREPNFNINEVRSCYYWSVYGHYFSQINISISTWFNAGRGWEYSIKLFEEIITHFENKIISNVNSQK